MKKAFIFALALVGLVSHASDKKSKKDTSEIFVLTLVKPRDLKSTKQFKKYTSRKRAEKSLVSHPDRTLLTLAQAQKLILDNTSNENKTPATSPKRKKRKKKDPFDLGRLEAVLKEMEL